MLSVYFKEIHAFFSTLIGYIVIGVFLISVGLFMWVFSDTSVLDYNFATMDQLFSIAPLVFLFLIPAVTMRSFAEERAKGTIELLYTKPLTNYSIIGGKYLANMTLVVFALLPTLLYYYSVYQLGSPVGNLDTGAIIGSYIGMFASTLTNNQIVAFVLGAFLCFFFHWAFQYIAKMPIFTSGLDLFVQKLGINYHYASISKGLLDSRDIIYFISVVFVFIYATVQMLEKRK